MIQDVRVKRSTEMNSDHHTLVGKIKGNNNVDVKEHAKNSSNKSL